MADRIHDPATNCYIRETAGRSGGQNAETDTLQRRFLVYKNADPLVCRQAMVNQKAVLNLEEFAGLYLDSLAWTLSAGSDQWEFTADYSWTPKPGEYTITMDSTGGTVLSTEAYSQAAYVAPGETAPDYGMSINVQDGDPAGTERIIPALKFNVNARIATEYIPDALAYAATVASLTGFTNAGSFLNFAPHECLFMGATGEIVGDNPLLTFSFAASPNLVNYTIGGITGINKNGHDYIWFKYKTIKDSATKFNRQKAIAAYVSRLYETADFNQLSIGRAPT